MPLQIMIPGNHSSNISAKNLSSEAPVKVSLTEQSAYELLDFLMSKCPENHPDLEAAIVELADSIRRASRTSQA